MSPVPMYPSEWAMDVTAIVGVICGLIICIGVTWILFKLGVLLEKMAG